MKLIIVLIQIDHGPKFISHYPGPKMIKVAFLLVDGVGIACVHPSIWYLPGEPFIGPT